MPGINIGDIPKQLKMQAIKLMKGFPRAELLLKLARNANNVENTKEFQEAEKEVVDWKSKIDKEFNKFVSNPHDDVSFETLMSNIDVHGIFKRHYYSEICKPNNVQ